MPSSKRTKAQAVLRDEQLERSLIEAMKTFRRLGLSEDILRAVFNGAPVDKAIEEARPEISKFLSEHMIESHRVGRSWTYGSFAKHMTAPRSFVINEAQLSPGDRVTLPKYVKVAGGGRDYGTVEHAEVVGVTPRTAILRKVNPPEDAPTLGPTSDIRVPRKLAERHRDPGSAIPRTRIVTNARDLIEIRSAEVNQNAIQKYTNDSEVKSFRLTRDVQDAVAETMARARAAGENLTTTTNMVKERLESFGISGRPHRIETIVRTNNAIASSAGQWSANQDPDIAEILWGYTYVTVGDDRVRPEHAALDGTTLPKDDIFWTRNMPPNGWNSVPAWTRVLTTDGWKPISHIQHGEYVLTHRGRWRPVYERHLHEGPTELVAIEAEAVGVGPLYLTANHEVFTQRGWVDAGGLQVGDQILHPVRVVNNKSALDINDSNYSQAFANPPVTPDRRFTLRPVDFDSEVERWYEKVEPIGRRRSVVLPFDIQAVEYLGEFPFVSTQRRRRVRMGHGIRSILASFVSSHLAAHFRAPRGRADAEFVNSLLDARRVLGVGNSQRIGTTENLNPFGFENTTRGAVMDAGLFGEFGNQRAASAVISRERSKSPRPRFINSGLGDGDVGGRTVGLFSHDVIVSVSRATINKIYRVPWKNRMVWNLGVEEDESYIAEGIAVHNCRCSAIEVFNDERREQVRPPDVVSVELNDDSFRDVRPGADEGFDFNPGQLVSSGVPLMLNNMRLTGPDRVLCALNELGGAASMTEVAKSSGLAKSTVSYHVNGLRQSGMVDHRYGEYVTRLTEQGAQRAERVSRPVCACC